MVDHFQVAEIKGRPVYASDGEKIGDVSDVFVDDQTRQPEWVSIGTGIFGMKNRLVPIEGASFTAEGLRVPFDKDRVKDAPDVDIDHDHLAQSDENDLYEYYGLRRGMGSTSAGGMSSGTTQGRMGDSMASGTSPGARPRLRKWTDTF
jgi:sporulation protein YlmC with PRC-barrel domain